MQLEPKFFCHWDIVRFVKEDMLAASDVFMTLSVTDNDRVELMIFLGKADNNSDYEVRVYKSEPSDKYIPNKYDNVKHYEENDEYATFIFEDFEDAHDFVDTLSYRHIEYKVRPIRPLHTWKD